MELAYSANCLSIAIGNVIAIMATNIRASLVLNTEVCSRTPAAPPTRIYPKTFEVMIEFVIEDEKVSNLL